VLAQREQPKKPASKTKVVAENKKIATKKSETASKEVTES
jgi:hypothetical protein